MVGLVLTHAFIDKGVESWTGPFPRMTQGPFFPGALLAPSLLPPQLLLNPSIRHEPERGHGRVEELGGGDADKGEGDGRGIEQQGGLAFPIRANGLAQGGS
jgi:hypothetical protein